MNKVDSLIKMLTELKEELNKNMNSSYGSTDQNMAKDAPDANATADIVRPDAGYGKVTVKDTTPKPADPKRPYGKVIMKDEQQDQPKVNLNNPYNDQDEDEAKEKVKVKNIKEEAEEILDMHKEECTFAKNGQWSLKKGTWREDQRAKEPMDMTPSPAEKNMPLNPTKPKAVDKPMGANKKPVLASRHKTGTPRSEKDSYSSIESTPVPKELKEDE